MDPWNIATDKDSSLSPDGTRRIVFQDLTEIAMGGPEGGDCFILCQDGNAIYIGGWCGGPAVWSDDGKLLALPFWTKNRHQRLAVADLETMTLRLSQDTFSVLWLDRIENGHLHGLDSPLVSRENFAFDLKAMPWLRERALFTTPWPYRSFGLELNEGPFPGTAQNEREAMRELDDATTEWYSPTELWRENPEITRRAEDAERNKGFYRKAGCILAPVLLPFLAVQALIVFVLTQGYAVIYALTGKKLAPPAAFRDRLEERMTDILRLVFNPLLRLFKPEK